MYDKAALPCGLDPVEYRVRAARRHPHWARPGDYVTHVQAHKGLGCDAKSALLGSAAPV